MTGSLSLVPGTISSGRRSPVRSPDGAVGGSGRRSPSSHLSTRLRSPNEMKSFDSRSPTMRSPTRDNRRSPTNSICQDRKSPTTAFCVSTQVSLMSMFEGNAPYSNIQSNIFFQQVQCGFDPDLSGDRNSRARTPTGLAIPILRRTSINTYTATQRPPELSRTSPSRIVMAIPPITVSNPSETIAIVARMNAERTAHRSPEKVPTPEKKSMMRDLFSFVKKPKSTGSTSSSTTTATSRNRFTSAFSRATISSSGSVSSSVGSPSLVRQCTYSSGSGAIPKQMSDSSSGFEPRLSFKFAKMSLRLRNRFSSERKKTTTITVQQAQNQQQHQVCSNKQSDRSSYNKSRGDNNNVDNTNTDAVPFELANVHFEKVGESYIKHDKSKRYNNDNHNNNNTNTNNHTNNNHHTNNSNSNSSNDALDVADRLSALSNENAQLLDAILGASASTGSLVKRAESREPVEPRISEECEEAVAEAEKQSDDKFIPEVLRDEIERLIKPIELEPVYVNIVELRNEINNNRKEDEDEIFHKPLNCPTIEFEPPSRRSSFDPPRSPYLENLRSSCGSTGGASTDTELLLMSRLNSGEDSFEIMDSERRRESSFEGPVSTYTSYDMSRYQSTSCEDPGSSFEIVDVDQTNSELRKSSIEFVDSITLQRTDSKRKFSLETHFDYNPAFSPNTSQATSAYVSDTCTTPRQRSPAFPIGRKHRNSTFGLIAAPKSPLSNQTSSNYSSRDSYDSNSSNVPLLEPKDPHVEIRPVETNTKRHFPLTFKAKCEEDGKSFLCTDKRCESIFEPRPSLKTINSGVDSGMSVLSSSGEFDPPSPRRCSSVSPQHMFTFKIVMKKVDSMPHPAPGSRKNSETLVVSNERRRSRTLEKLRRRDSRKKDFRT